MDQDSVIFPLIDQHFDRLRDDWLAYQRRDGAIRAGQDAQREAVDMAGRFLKELRRGARQGRIDTISVADWAPMRELLQEVSTARVTEGFTPSQTASFVFSLKEPVFELLRREVGKDADALARETLLISRLLDALGLYTFECYSRTREEMIGRQQQELMELSTPVVELWKGVLALPLIGTLDSQRTQIVMENLLERIVGSEAEIAIIDITGVPTVDTLVAQHLIKTVSAARLMGADCIISGIRPQIAQTIVHLGLELNVVSKATMADAFALALRRLGRTVVERSAVRVQEK
ncbi:MAG TPA: STAS domain-containing protein [Acetobacteraceae bacterium]|jgi:rsbT co-antagonist protein RsbR